MEDAELRALLRGLQRSTSASKPRYYHYVGGHLVEYYEGYESDRVADDNERDSERRAHDQWFPNDGDCHY